MVTKNAAALRRGFTLVELLVVIAIIGILVALLLPAIQAAREAARRTGCSNKLKNLGLAVLNHHDVKKHFPVSMGLDIIDDGSFPGDTTPQSAVGWILNTLPQLEEQPLFDQFVAAGAFEGNFVSGACRLTPPKVNFGIASSKNGVAGAKLMQTQLQILQCPSDESVSQLTSIQFQWDFCPVATTSYKGVIDDTWINLEFSDFHNDTSNEYRSGIYAEPIFPGGPNTRDCHRDTRCRGIFSVSRSVGQ